MSYALDDKIRELEAELARTTKAFEDEIKIVAGQRARAEKAEAELASQRALSGGNDRTAKAVPDEVERLRAEITRLHSPANRWWLDIVARAEKAEARVAELVDEIDLIIRHYKIEDYDLSVLEREAKP